MFSGGALALLLMDDLVHTDVHVLAIGCEIVVAARMELETAVRLFFLFRDFVLWREPCAREHG